MHPNQIYHTASADQNLAFARERAFGVLAASGPDAPLMSHVPFLLNAAGDMADLHLVRSNPIARALNSGGALATRLAVSGPDSYVSPDWYGIDDQVPTWNYVAVHLTGSLELRPQDELYDLLDRQSGFFEQQLLPKVPWTMDKMPPDALDKMMRMIVPCRLTITAVDGTWKLAQNKPDAARISTADHMDGYGIGSETRILAALIRGAIEP